MTTRDRNATALISDFLGARALGVRNVLCTSGTHSDASSVSRGQECFRYRCHNSAAKSAWLEKNATIVGEQNIDGDVSYCLGAVASPFADPVELQLPRSRRKIFVGAQFIVTQPVFDLERFGLWWKAGCRPRSAHKSAFIAGHTGSFRRRYDKIIC